MSKKVTIECAVLDTRTGAIRTYQHEYTLEGDKDHIFNMPLDARGKTYVKVKIAKPTQGDK